MKLDSCTTITDANKFLECHRLFIKTYEGKRIAEPYKDRLEKYLKMSKFEETQTI